MLFPRFLVIGLFVCMLGCSNKSVTTVEPTELDEVLAYVKQEFPDFRVLDRPYSSRIRSPFPEVTNQFVRGDLIDHPSIISMDLNGDSYKEYLALLIRTESWDGPLTQFDSSLTAQTVIVFGNENGFSHTTENLYRSGSLFQGDYLDNINIEYGFILPGTYPRGFPFTDSVTVSTAALGSYTNATVAITEWFDTSTYQNYLMYAD